MVGLQRTQGQRHLQGCFDRLTLSLSALRVMLEFGAVSPLDWWQRSLWLGHDALPSLKSNPFAGLAYGLTDLIRLAALRGLIGQYPDDAFQICAQALQADDISVNRTAVAGLHRIQDRRALPLLQPIAFSERHPLTQEARRAIETIAGSQAEPLTLLRGSHADANVTVHDSLLRALDPGSVEQLSTLLKPSVAHRESYNGGSRSE